MTAAEKTSTTASNAKVSAATAPPIMTGEKSALVKRVAKKPMSRASTVIKASPKPVVKPLPKAASKASVKPVAKPKAETPVRGEKPKLVNDSFNFPKSEYTVLDELKQRARKLAKSVKKSELVRAGVKALAAMTDTAFLAAVKLVPTLKARRNTK